MSDQQGPTTVDLLVVLTRLETKLDHATAGIADHETRLRTMEDTALTKEDLTPVHGRFDSQSVRLDAHAVRLTGLEHWRSRLGGVGAVVGTLGGSAAGALVSYLLS